MPDRTPSPTVDRADELRDAIVASGYYPAVVSDAVEGALGGEEVRAFFVHHEPTFDRDEVRRHVTVVALTPTRLVLAHTDEHPPDDLLPQPYASTSTEAVPVTAISSVVTTRMVANPASYAGEGTRPDGADEAVLTIGWGAVGRIDLEPATCGDPDCEGDHGYSGTMTADDFSIRVSSAAEGKPAVHQVLSFAATLSAATAGNPR